MFHPQNLSYSMKNIPLHSKDTYLKKLIQQTESFIKRLRWRAYWFLKTDDEPDEQQSEEKYGFKSPVTPPQIPELVDFEHDMYNMIANAQFNKTENEFQKKMKEDIKRLKSCSDVIVSADKTSNLYTVDTQQYQKLLTDSVTAEYKKAPPDVKDEIDRGTNIIARGLKLEDRMEKYTDNI